MIERLICGLLLVVAIIHLMPLVGVLSPERLHSLYGLSFEQPDLQILMRHRAVLFGLLGAFIAWAAFHPALQPLAFIAAGLSIASFFALAFGTGAYGPAIHKIIIGDIVAAVALLAAIGLYLTHPPA